MNEKIRKPKLEKHKSTHLTKKGYYVLRNEKKRLLKLKKEGKIEEAKSMMELIEDALIKNYG